MGTKKVAVFTYSLEPGAMANVGITLVRGFNELGMDCDLVVLNASNEQKAGYPDINIVTLNASRAAFSLIPLIHYLRTKRPDAVFSMPHYNNLITILAKYLSGANTKIIITEHNICSLEIRIEHSKNIRFKLLQILMPHIYPYADGLIAVAEDVITDLLEKIKVPDRIPMTVIPNPMDINRIQKLTTGPINHCWLRDKKDVPVILTVARLAKQKQLDVLIHAFARVIKFLPAKLLILGKGPLKTELELLCEKLGVQEQVFIRGFAPNPYKFMSACDIFVLPSAWEGCPIVLLEALACGAAVITTDGPGGAKDIIGYGKYGMLVPAGTVDALTEGMINLLSDDNLRKRYRERAQKRALDFHYIKIARKYLDFYHFLTQKLQKRDFSN